MFEATARLKIRDGQLEGFKRLAAEIMTQTKEKDTKPLRYDWFLSDDGRECEVREAYEDADALLAQQLHVRELKAELFRGFVEGHDMTFYGEPSARLAETMEAMAGAVEVTQFSLFQGLDAHVEAPHEVPA